MWWRPSVVHFVIANHLRINRKPNCVVTVASDRNRKTQSCFFCATFRSMSTVYCMLLVIEIETVKTTTKTGKKETHIVWNPACPLLNLLLNNSDLTGRRWSLPVLVYGRKSSGSASHLFISSVPDPV